MTGREAPPRRVVILPFDQMVPSYADDLDMPNYRRLRTRSAAPATELRFSVETRARCYQLDRPSTRTLTVETDGLVPAPA